jgi:hypothetical protein
MPHIKVPTSGRYEKHVGAVEDMYAISFSHTRGCSDRSRRACTHERRAETSKPRGEANPTQRATGELLGVYSTG